MRVNMNKQLLESLSEDELYEVAEYGIQERINLRLTGLRADDHQFLYDALEKLDDMNAEELKQSILIHSELYQLEKPQSL